jgi:hypothetical protein
MPLDLMEVLDSLRSYVSDLQTRVAVLEKK